MLNLLKTQIIMELLKNLYGIHSMSGQENAMRKFIKGYVRDNVPGAEVRQDHKNLYIVKGDADTYPCVVAHLDQVQTKHSADFTVFEHEGILFAYSAMNKRQEGLGADDKNGIWVALKCLEHYDSIKVAFFHSEEIGTVGSGQADMAFFKDCRFVLEADRRNGGDLITDICGKICSDEFLADIADIAEAHGYKETSGMLTDVETLSDNGLGLSAINMSCGYYNPHTDEECTVVDELWNCLYFAMDIIDNCKGVYPFKREKKSWANWSSGSWKGGWWHYGGKSGGTGSSVADKYASLYDDDDEVREYNRGFFGDVDTVDFKDFPTPDDAIFQFCVRNINWGQDELWDYIEADCATYGIDYGDFLEIYDEAFEYCLGEEETEKYF